MFDVVIEGATIVSSRRTFRANVGVVGEKIAAIDHAPIPGKNVIDGSGKWLIPGIIDTHLHLQPELSDDELGGGLEPWADGYDSGTIAAAFGGVTSVIDMRIQEQRPGARAVAAVVQGLEDASRKAVIDFSFHAGLTYPSKETLAEIPELVEMGIPSFKFFLTYPNWRIRVDLGFLYDAFLAIRANNGIAAVHCEDDQVIEHRKRKFVSEGRKDHRYGQISRRRSQSTTSAFSPARPAPRFMPCMYQAERDWKRQGTSSDRARGSISKVYRIT